jgi:hypothetical protein
MYLTPGQIFVPAFIVNITNVRCNSYLLVNRVYRSYTTNIAGLWIQNDITLRRYFYQFAAL